MVTTFTLQKGYVHCKEQELTNDEFEMLVKGITQKQLRDKCIEYGLTEDLPCTCKLSKLLAKYKHLPTDDLTCYFSYADEFDKDNEHSLEINQDACMMNGSEHTLVRHIICKAFAILVLDAAYKQNKSLSFTII